MMMFCDKVCILAGRWVDIAVCLCLCECVSVCLGACVCVCVKVREALQMLKLYCLSKAAVPIFLYLSHAQKVLPQKVAVPHPHLRFPWRYLHPQVGITLMPPSSFAPECFALFAGHTHITCSFGVCITILYFLIHCARPETALFLWRYDHSAHNVHTRN